MENHELRFEHIFKISDFISVPAYQRAYSWGEKQLNEFVMDLLEIGDKNYYYGHFIFEKVKEREFEVIDGQQRLTTFILFLMVCNLYTENKYDHLIKKFATVSYDQEALQAIQNNLIKKKEKWELSDFNLSNTNKTLSITRILGGLNFFKEAFKEKLDVEKINKYVNTFLKAHVSIHSTNDKAVAVQIFELQNSRGISLDLIEKVKAKLMKAIYLIDENCEATISRIQYCFAEIYKYEEQISKASFREDLPLDELLGYHLRVVDDGTKFELNPDFTQPSMLNREESILKYLNLKINESEKNVVEYIIGLAESFKQTVRFMSEEIKELDKINPLIGDVLILDKRYSVQFLLLIHHKFKKNADQIFVNNTFQLWEQLLFTSNFHWKYYRKTYRDDYESLFKNISEQKEVEKVRNILENFVKVGFRPKLMEDNNLQKTVSEFVIESKNSILNNAFHFFQQKMIYTLYKFELFIGADKEKLRKVMKKNRSIEHILPRGWEAEWIKENGKKEMNTEELVKKRKEIETVINGLGNLLLISKSENASKSNSHPKDKKYNFCTGGSYEEHNQNSISWEDYNSWIPKIQNRGEKIYNFMLRYFELSQIE